MKRKTIQEKAFNTITQRPEDITVGGRKYTVARPNLATIFAVRAILSRVRTYEGSTFVDALRSIENKDVVVEILATLVLGVRKRSLSIIGNYEYRRHQEKVKRLMEDIEYHLEPKEIDSMLFTLMDTEQITSFFGITVSLAEMQQTKPTTETERTTSGQ